MNKLTDYCERLKQAEPSSETKNQVERNVMSTIVTNRSQSRHSMQLKLTTITVGLLTVIIGIFYIIKSNQQSKNKFTQTEIFESVVVDDDLTAVLLVPANSTIAKEEK